MHLHVGDGVEPALSLLIEIGVVNERPSVDEIVPEVADRTLDFALGESRQLRLMRVLRIEFSGSPIRFTR